MNIHLKDKTLDLTKPVMNKRQFINDKKNLKLRKMTYDMTSIISN